MKLTNSPIGKYLFIMVAGLISPNGLLCQDNSSINLEQCYQWTQENHPLVNRKGITTAQIQVKDQILNKNWLPQIDLSLQAAYQSEVTELPGDLPNLPFESISRDQYRLLSEFSQPIYDGGLIANKKSMNAIEGHLANQMIEIELYRLKELVLEWYFGILRIDIDIQQLDLLSADIDNNINQTVAGIDNGTLLRSNLDILRAEKIEIEQRKLNLYYNRTSYLGMLSILTGKDFSPAQQLAMPPLEPALLKSKNIERPELALYDLQKQSIAAKERIRTSYLKPRINAFLNTGIGRPGLNFLSNDISTYYQTGVRLNWPLTNFYNDKNEKQLQQLEIENISNQESVFHHQISIEVKQLQTDVDKYFALLEKAEEIVSLRTAVKQRAFSQYQNGVLRASDYLRELHKEEKAMVSMKKHELLLIKTIETWKNTTGIQ